MNNEQSQGKLKLAYIYVTLQVKTIHVIKIFRKLKINVDFNFA